MRAGLTGMVIVAAALAAAAVPASASLAPAPPRPLEFLHVGSAGGPTGLPQVLDSSGRQVLLKGVNVDGIVDYFRSDLRTPYPTDPAAYANGACPPDDKTVGDAHQAFAAQAIDIRQRKFHLHARNAFRGDRPDLFSRGKLRHQPIRKRCG